MAKFWTESTLLPYQKHNFKVNFNLRKIDSGILNRITGPNASANSEVEVRENQVKKVRIPPHHVKAINLPKFTAELTPEQSGYATDAKITAQQGDFEDLQITFYMVGAMAEILPEIFFAYYLNFGSDGIAEIPYLQKGLSFATDYNKKFVSESNIQIALMNNDRTIYLNYNNVLPVSFDLGEISYGESDIIEATMNFQYNMPWENDTPFKVTSPGNTTQPSQEGGTGGNTSSPSDRPSNDNTTDSPKNSVLNGGFS